MKHVSRLREYRATRRAVALLPLLLSIAACDSVPSRPILLQREPPGRELLECAPEPPMPEFESEAERYDWAARAIFAGRDCRERLRSLREWVLRPPEAQ